jgi:hypothetical protein
MRRIHLGIAILLPLYVPVTARAVDGVLEINQACAVNTGCFAGDSPGFPVTIAGGSGSFRLTSSLSTNSGSTTFIEITPVFTNTGFVIDLNGFSMTCEDTFGGDCSPQTGGGRGVSASGVSKVTVMNGGIVNVGFRGVELGDDCVVKDTRITQVGGTAIVGGHNCQILRNLVEGNHDGILAFNGALVANNTVVGNGFSSGGIFLGEGCKVIGNVVRDNFVGLGLANFYAEATCGYAQNVFTNSTSPADSGVSAKPIEIGTNICGNNTTCP